MIPSSKIRFRLVMSGVALVFIFLYVRLFYLQVVKHEFYKLKSQNQLNKVIQLYPHRGRIYDRNHQPLAITKTTYSLYATPPKIADKFAFARVVSRFAQVSGDEVLKKIDGAETFVWLKRKVDIDDPLALKKLNLAGLNFVPEEKRIYPNGVFGGQILGFVGIDNQGLGGVEYQFDRILKGSPEQLVVEGDARGYSLITNPIHKEKLRFDLPQTDGVNVGLTIDNYVQYVTQKHLREGIRENGAVAGQAIVLDPKSGEILAMANVPEFDPNDWRDFSGGQTKNRCLTDSFEPGSTFKLVSIGAALDEGVVEPNTIFYVPEKIEFNGRTIKEAHKRLRGESASKSVSDILTDSLNVGTSLIIQKLGREKFYAHIKKFHFGERLGSELPGESAGLLRSLAYWSAVDIAMISFGQGIAVTPLQMACAAGAIANKGVMMRPKLVKFIGDYSDSTMQTNADQVLENQALSPATCEKLTAMMKRVVDEGTGTPAQIPGYDIVGKTGTAQKPRPGGAGYDPGKYVASFLGFFPMKNPKVVIFVVISEPKKNIYGSVVAGPVFKAIAKDLIQYYGIAPDHPEELGKSEKSGEARD